MARTPEYTKDHLKDLIEAGVATVGEHTYGLPTVRRWPGSANLHIGRYCSIAEEVLIFPGGNHRSDWVTTYPFSHINGWEAAHQIKGHPSTRGDIIIGNDVWVGFGSLILSGVTIGDGAVIGARSVVTKSVPPYAIVAGNPAKIMRYRFSKRAVKRLLEMQWWNWPHEKVEVATLKLLSRDVEGFLETYSTQQPITTRFRAMACQLFRPFARYVRRAPDY
ncbi:MAG: CatB-related O-acetyltransferase [Rhodospirillales bacterium]|nr:CatB-related O-acetyltransferase [Rhodospirillales bacterium]